MDGSAKTARGVLLRDALLVGGAALLVLVPSLFTRDLWNPDEPRYMEVAREMVDLGGDAWVVPRLNGELYREKPPLFFWLAAVLHRAGAGLVAGRLVSLAAALATIALLYAFVLRWRGAAAARTAALALTTSWLFLEESKAGVLNPLLTACTTAAAVLGFAALHAGTAARRTGLWLGAYAAIALAGLTKGPVGLLVVAPPLVGYAVLRRERVRGGGWAHLAGAALAAAMVATWLVPAAHVAGWDYVRDITLGQVARRVADGATHEAPWWKYFVAAPGHLFPWSLVVPLAIVAAWRARRREPDGPAAFLLLWAVGGFLAFSAISGKRSGYLVPLLPAFAGLVGAYFADLAATSSRSAWPRRLAAATCVAALIAALATTGGAVALALAPDAVARHVQKWEEALPDAPDETLRLLAAAAFGALLVSVAALGLAWTVRGRVVPALRLLTAWAVAGSLFVDLLATPVLDEVNSPRRLLEAAAPHLPPGGAPTLFHKGYDGTYNVYLGRSQLEVIDRAGLRARLEGDGAFCVLGDEKWFERVAGALPWREHVVLRRPVGHATMVLLARPAVLTTR